MIDMDTLIATKILAGKSGGGGDSSSVVTGVKGSNESNYRTGNVNISKDDIGLTEIDNTSDADKPVSTAQRTAIDAVTTKTVEVTGTDVIITAVSNTRYICGELSTLSFTPCSSGLCDVRFTSGSSKTILTLPNTVKMPDGFEVDSDTVYEINILDGVYGVVASWPI